MQQIHQNHSHLNHFFQMVEIFMKLIQLLFFFCQKIQFKSHKSRSFNGNHFSNMWVCFVLIFLNTFMCSFYKKICVIFLHKFLCNFAKGQLSFLKISVCYLYFPFFVNKLHIFNCKNYQCISDESEPSWLEPQLELKDSQLGWAWLVTFFTSARNKKIGRKRAEIRFSV